MHQWAVSTSLTFPLSADPSSRELNTTVLPTLALQNPALLYAIFFLSALHLLKTTTYNAENDEAYGNYIALTIRHHRIDVNNLNGANADVVCVTSSLLRLGYFAMLQERPLLPYSPPSQWMHMNAALGTVHRETWAWIQNNPTSIARRALVQKTPNLRDFDALFEHSNRDPLLHLLTDPPGVAPEEWSPEIEAAYDRTLAFVGGMQANLDNGTDGPNETLRRCLAFPAMCPKEFFNMVEEGRPRATVIMAHYFAYLARFKDTWWIGDSGRREVNAIAAVLPLEWQDMMSWPLQELDRVYSAGWNLE
jgi:hypothetical protein